MVGRRRMVAAGVLALGLTLTGCAGSPESGSSGRAAGGAATTGPAPGSAECKAAVSTWYGAHGAGLNALTGTLTVPQATTADAAQMATLSTQADQLLASVRTLRATPPPSCDATVAGAFELGMTKSAAAAGEAKRAVTEFDRQDRLALAKVLVAMAVDRAEASKAFLTIAETAVAP